MSELPTIVSSLRIVQSEEVLCTPNTPIKELLLGSYLRASGPGSHVIFFKICIRNPTKEWFVTRRFSEFVTLDSQLKELGFHVPLSLPSKGYTSLLRFNSNSSEFLDSRKRSLDAYLNGLLDYYGPFFKKFWHSAPLCWFLALSPELSPSPPPANSSKESGLSFDSISSVFNDIDEIVVQVMSSSDSNSLSLKERLFNDYTLKVKLIEKTLDSHGEKDTELWNNYRQKLKVLKSNHSALLKVCRNSETNPRSDDSSSSSARQMLHAQNQLLQSQNQHISGFLSVIKTQKEMGRLIGNELDEQNKILEKMNSQVSSTLTKLDKSTSKLKKLF